MKDIEQILHILSIKSAGVITTYNQFIELYRYMTIAEEGLDKDIIQEYEYDFTMKYLISLTEKLLKLFDKLCRDLLNFIDSEDIENLIRSCNKQANVMITNLNNVKNITLDMQKAAYEVSAVCQLTHIPTDY